jgi:glutathione S-transferase
MLTHMTQPILHHYPTSPFAEMVRLTFGLKRLAWSSCIHPNILPRPVLSALAGGYRRIPVMQVGADVFCDTQAILRALDRLHPSPPLSPPGQEGLDWALRIWAERPWFQASVAVIFGALGRHVPEAFIKDREQLSGRPFDVEAMQAAAPMLAAQWRAQAQLLEERLRAGQGPFLYGPAAGLADIAAYMNIWFLRGALKDKFAGLCADMPALNMWADRVAAIGHGVATEISPDVALALAHAAEPAPPLPSDPHDAQGFKPGDQVTVMADDYGRDPVVGAIWHVRPLEIAVLRETPEAGRVVVHFPRAGFMVRPAT